MLTQHSDIIQVTAVKQTLFLWVREIVLSKKFMFTLLNLLYLILCNKKFLFISFIDSSLLQPAFGVIIIYKNEYHSRHERSFYNNLSFLSIYLPFHQYYPLCSLLSASSIHLIHSFLVLLRSFTSSGLLSVCSTLSNICVHYMYNMYVLYYIWVCTIHYLFPVAFYLTFRIASAVLYLCYYN